MGNSNLRVVQLGVETTWGTNVAATAKFMGVTDFNFKPAVTNTQRRYLEGAYTPVQKVVQTDKRGQAMIAGDFSFEDMPMVLQSAITGTTAGTGAGTDKTWTFTFPTSSVTAFKSHTLEFYDGTQEWEMGGSIVSSFSLSGEAAPDGVVQFTSNWIGKEITSSTVTGALSTHTFEPLAASVCQLWIDDLGGTIGSTASTATLISWNFDYASNVHLKKFQDGAITTSTFGYGLPDATLQLTLEYNANGDTEIDKFVAGTGRLVRIKGLGTLLTGVIYKTLQIDMAGDIVDIAELWGDRDGNTIAVVTLKPRYDAGAFASWGAITVINAVTPMPG